jgi:signal transduction histidine kinase
MLSPSMSNASQTVAPYWQVPRLRADRRWLSGVAAAIAAELGVDALWIRLSLGLLTLVGGVGLVLYAVSWLWFAYHARRHPEQQYIPMPKGATPAGRALGVSLVVLGLGLGADRVLSAGIGDATVWPVAVSMFGVLMVWSSGKVDWSAPTELVRAVIGFLLVAVGVVAFVVSNLGLAVAPKALVISTVVLAGVILVVAPWLWRAASQVGEDRLERIRADERARLAAHLHDSVLQTLSLIQSGADDKQTTVNLARRQERELREWLFRGGSRRSGEQHFRAALTELAAEVEELHGVPVEVVVVGDGLVDESVQTSLAATRELIVNAAKHSGAARVDVYGEISSDQLEIFVRDKGAGFDPGRVPPDRRGLADSVIGRVERIGGTVTINSSANGAAGDDRRGTEVALVVPMGQRA